MARRGGGLSLRRIGRETIGLWRRHLVALTLLAAVIEVPLVLAEVLFHIDPSWRRVVEGRGRVTGAGFVVLYGALSHHLMAGLLEGLVAGARRGHRDPRLAEVLRGLPWGRLLLADLLLTALAFVGFALFVLPGLVVLTWFSIVAPVINLERRGVLASFRRSHHLVAQRPWRVAAVALSAFAVPEIVVGVVATLAHTGHTVADAVIHAVPATILLPVAALPLVILTFDLVALDARRAGDGAGGDEVAG